MSHILAGMKTANISEERLRKLQSAEKDINNMSGGTKEEEIYLLALTKQGQ